MNWTKFVEALTLEEKIELQNALIPTSNISLNVEKQEDAVCSGTPTPDIEFTDRPRYEVRVNSVTCGFCESVMKPFATNSYFCPHCNNVVTGLHLGSINMGEEKPKKLKSDEITKVVDYNVSEVKQMDETLTRELPKTVKEKKQTRFRKPTVEEITAEFQKRGNKAGFQFDEIFWEKKAGEYFDFYESKGWTIGKSPMKSWEAAVGTWVRNMTGSLTGKEKARKVSEQIVKQMMGLDKNLED
jgi:hypothetical protein